MQWLYDGFLAQYLFQCGNTEIMGHSNTLMPILMRIPFLSCKFCNSELSQFEWTIYFDNIHNIQTGDKVNGTFGNQNMDLCLGALMPSVMARAFVITLADPGTPSPQRDLNSSIFAHVFAEKGPC